MGRNQYQPVRDGSINKPRTASQMQEARDAIEMARNPASLRGNLEAEGIRAEHINYLMGSTGFRTGAAFNDPSQNVNVVKYKNHFFNTAGNKDVKTMLAEVENGGTGGGYGSGDYAGGSQTGPGGTTFTADRPPLDPAIKSRIQTMFGGPASSSKSFGQRTGKTESGIGYVPGGSNLTGTDNGELQRQTEQRNQARQQITEQSQQMIQTALQAIAQQNGVNSQAIAAAQQAVQLAMSAGQQQRPTLVGATPTSGSGGGIGGMVKSTAASLASNLNPLKGIFK